MADDPKPRRRYTRKTEYAEVSEGEPPVTRNPRSFELPHQKRARKIPRKGPYIYDPFPHVDHKKPYVVAPRRRVTFAGTTFLPHQIVLVPEADATPAIKRGWLWTPEQWQQCYGYEVTEYWEKKLRSQDRMVKASNER